MRYVHLQPFELSCVLASELAIIATTKQKYENKVTMTNTKTNIDQNNRYNAHECLYENETLRHMHKHNIGKSVQELRVFRAGPEQHTHMI